MKAIGVTTFGGPEVLQVFELPEPHAPCCYVKEV